MYREVGQWHEVKEQNVYLQFPFLKSAKGANVCGNFVSILNCCLL